MEMDGPLGEWLNDNTYRWEGGLSLSVPSNWHVNDFEIHSGLYSEHPYKDIQRSCQTSIEGKYMGAPWILKPTGALFYEVISLHIYLRNYCPLEIASGRNRMLNTRVKDPELHPIGGRISPISLTYSM